MKKSEAQKKEPTPEFKNTNCYFPEKKHKSLDWTGLDETTTVALQHFS